MQVNSMLGSGWHPIPPPRGGAARKLRNQKIGLAMQVSEQTIDLYMNDLFARPGTGRRRQVGNTVIPPCPCYERGVQDRRVP